MALEVHVLAHVGLRHLGGRAAGRRAVPPHLGLLDQLVLSSGHRSIAGWNFLDQTRKLKSSSHLLDYKNMLTRPGGLHIHILYKWFGGVVMACAAARAAFVIFHLVTNPYQAASLPRAVGKSLGESAVSRSTHLHIQIALLRF